MKIRFDGETTKKNTAFFIIVSVVCFLLASSVIPFFTVFGTMPCPDLLLCLCCVLPRFCAFKKSCVYAVALGFLSDLFINTPHLLSPVIYLAAAVLIPYFYGHIKKTGTVSAAVCSLPILLLRAILGTVVVLVIRQEATLGTVLKNIAFPELIVNFAFVLILGFILRVLTKHFGIQNEDGLF